MKFGIIFTGILMTFLLSCSNDAKNYDGIIAEIKKQDLPFGKLEKYKIEDFTNTSILKKTADDYIKDRGKGRGIIWIFKTRENLVVFIETRDDGHAGEYGVVYSESGETPGWNHDEWGEFWSIGKKINGHWWEIYFDLG